MKRTSGRPRARRGGVKYMSYGSIRGYRHTDYVMKVRIEVKRGRLQRIV